MRKRLARGRSSINEFWQQTTPRGLDRVTNHGAAINIGGGMLRYADPPGEFKIPTGTRSRRAIWFHRDADLESVDPTRWCPSL